VANEQKKWKIVANSAVNPAHLTPQQVLCLSRLPFNARSRPQTNGHICPGIGQVYEAIKAFEKDIEINPQDATRGTRKVLISRCLATLQKLKQPLPELRSQDIQVDLCSK